MFALLVRKQQNLLVCVCAYVRLSCILYECMCVWHQLWASVECKQQQTNTYTTTPHSYSPVKSCHQKKPQSSLRCYCLSSSSSFGATEIVVGVEKLPWASHRPWWQHWRIHPWLGKNVSWQPSHTHTHTHAGHISSKVKKIGAFCVPVLQEKERKKNEEEERVLNNFITHLTRRVFFFFYYFLLLFLFKKKKRFCFRLKPSQRWFEQRFGADQTSQTHVYFSLSNALPLLVFSEEECLPFKRKKDSNTNTHTMIT